MKNKDFIDLIVRCRNCIHRETWKCPMNQYNADLNEYYDLTDDEGFCHLGEQNEEAEIHHNEYDNFLTSIITEVYDSLNK